MLPAVSYILLQCVTPIGAASLGSLVRGNSLRMSNRSIDSINNSLIEDNVYNAKKHWLSDRGEIPGREIPHDQKALKYSMVNGKIEQSYDPPYSNSGYTGETGISGMGMRKMNSVAYGPDGLAFGVIPGEIMDQIEDIHSDWVHRSQAFDAVSNIIEETSSLKALSSYAASFLKYLCGLLDMETNSKII